MIINSFYWHFTSSSLSLCSTILIFSTQHGLVSARVEAAVMFFFFFFFIIILLRPITEELDSAGTRPQGSQSSSVSMCGRWCSSTLRRVSLTETRSCSSSSRNLFWTNTRRRNIFFCVSAVIWKNSHCTFVSVCSTLNSQHDASQRSQHLKALPALTYIPRPRPSLCLSSCRLPIKPKGSR